MRCDVNTSHLPEGKLDGATFASDAIQHYKNVPTQRKQIMIAVNVGQCSGMFGLLNQEPTMNGVVGVGLVGNLSNSHVSCPLMTGYR